MARRRTRAAVLCGALALLAARALADEAWIREGSAVNVREGAGPTRAVLGAAEPGERVEVLGTLSGFTQVRRADGTQGWISSAFLVREAPPAARIAALEAEASELRAALAAAEREAAALRERPAAAALRERPAAAPEPDAGPEANIAAPEPAPRLPEAIAPRDARWLDWLVGALLLSTGMALGAMLRGLAGRRRTTRLRL
jgi:hypothetical protein